MQIEDAYRSKTILFTLMLVLSSFAGVATIPTQVSAITGNETLSVSNITTSSVDLHGANLDTSATYQWLVFVYRPSGSLHDSDSGYWNPPAGTSDSDTAVWSPPGSTSGQYRVNFRLYEYWNSTLLYDSNTSFNHNGTQNLSADSHEPNENDQSTSFLNTNTTHALTIHNGTDDDWFRTGMIGPTQTVWVNLTFTHSVADLYLSVYRATQTGKTMVAYSHSNSDNEQVVFNTTGTNGGSNAYIVNVWASSGATSYYNLSIEVTNISSSTGGGNNLSADQYEPNENQSGSTQVTTPFSASGLTIHNSTDDDFFQVSLAAGETIWSNLTFTHSLGDLDMEIQDSGGNRLDWSASTTSNEDCSWTSNSATNVWVYVSGWSGANNSYDITIQSSGGSTSGNNTTTTHQVYISNFAFISSNITIQSGDSVRWTNNDSTWHTATSASGAPTSFNSGSLSSGMNWSYTFTQAGTYNYSCYFHGSMSAVIIVQSSTSSTQNDAGMGGDAGNSSNTSYLLNPGSHSQYTGYVHDTNDVADVYEVYLPTGYELNASLSFATTNDYDLYLIDGNWTFIADFSLNNNPESVTTNNTNITGGGHSVYLGVEAWTGDGNYTLDIWVFGNTTSASPTVSVNMTDKENADNYYSNLVIGANYTFDYEILDYPFGQNGTNWTASFYYVATASEFWHNVTFQTTTAEGNYGIITTLYDNTTFMSVDWDVVYFEMMEATVTSDVGGSLYASNLTVGETYTVMWETYDNSTGSTLSNGTTNFTAMSTTWSSAVNWPTPNSFAEHHFATILVNSTGTTIGGHFEAFTPSPPTIEISGYSSNPNSTTNSVNTFAYDMVVGVGYQRQIVVKDSTNNTVASLGMTSFSASATNMTFSTYNYNTPNSTGVYCVYAYIYTAAGTMLDMDSNCFQMTFDADGDGVIDGDDLCPNTPPLATVDANGCSASQRDSDGDGYMDDIDIFPFDPTQWSDNDGDGYGDNATGNNPDAFPSDGTQWADTDGDGYGDNPQGNNPDAFPNDATQWSDQDGDGYGDNASGNSPDAFPTDGTQWADQDGDGHGDNQQGNDADAFPTDATQWSDQDGDGYGDNQLGNNPDAFPTDSTQWADQDGDGYGDNPSGNNPDAFTNDSTQWSDSDGDGFGDNANGNNGDHCPDTPVGEVVDNNGCSESQKDDDGDGVPNDEDLCPATSPGQIVNTQGCAQSQLDDDMDSVNNTWDQCPATAMGSSVDLNGCADSQLDTDNDSINNDRDLCPNSAPGAIVDGDGCADEQKDGDVDGIHDGLDNCPATTAGSQVDSQGCADYQKDSDLDQMMDDADLCPNTPAGMNVDFNGCAESQLDDDDDGHTNDVDQCPGTPSGVLVDDDGCAATQRDSDGDNFSDADDLCQDTPAGDAVDNDGCSERQKDSDADSLSDDLDLCPFTPTGSIVDADGCAESQRDSDQDGISDEDDDFPMDANESIDTDGDGVADRWDAFPADALRSEEAESSNNLVWILLAIIAMLAGGGVALFFSFGRRKGDVSDELYDAGSEQMLGEIAPAVSLQAMAGVEPVQLKTIAELPPPLAEEPAQEIVAEPQQWQDENGIYWSRQADGTTMYHDASADQWITV